MAARDTFVEKFTAKAVAHSDTSATTVLTIPTQADRHYELLIIAKVLDEVGEANRVGFIAEIEIRNVGGVVQANLNVIATNDPNATVYTISEVVSSTNVLIQITAAADSVSGAVATGISIEQVVTE